MESDPYLALAADCRRYGNVHTKRHVGINVQEEILIEAVAQFKRAIEEAKLQVFSNQELSLNLSIELRLKQRLLDEEQKTTDKLINVKKTRSNENILTLYFKGQKRPYYEIGGVTRAHPSTRAPAEAV